MARLGAGFARGSLKVPQLRTSASWPGARRDLPLQVARFTVIGVASTIAYLVLFLLYRHWVFGGPERAPDARLGEITIPRSDMATQGERIK
jgi:hypothetical protein